MNRLMLSQYDADDAAVGEYAAVDMQRWACEPPKTQDRTPFERDRARLIHSSALRRLGAKSQVLVAGSDDFVRTRLTHTLEVAQIGRQIALMLGCNPDVVDCACLAHDLGHPPFGHNGERALAELAYCIGGFEGNAQTLRLLTRLEPKIMHADGRSAGVNLTRAALDAAVKYPWTIQQACAHDKGERSLKFCVYPDEQEVFDWLKNGVESEQTPMECQIMDLSDDIAYSVHDVEDAIVIGALPVEALNDSKLPEALLRDIHAWYGSHWNDQQLIEAFERIRQLPSIPESFDGSRYALGRLKNMTSALIGRFARSVEHATRQQYGQGALIRYRAQVIIPPETSYEITVLKGLAVHFVMEPRNHTQVQQWERKILTDLVQALMELGPCAQRLMEPVFIADWKACSSDEERLRVAIDQVASLTDGSAVSMRQRLDEISSCNITGLS